MAYTGYKTVAFGSSKADLTTVGYTLFDGDGDTIVARSTSGVQDLGGGQYGASITFPDGFSGRLTWDTGEDTPAYASEAINDADDEADVATLEQLAAIREEVDTLVGEQEADIDAEAATPGVAFSEIIRSDVPTVEGCPLLKRLRAFVVDQTTLPQLRHIFRHQLTGAPVDLSVVLSPASESSSESSGTTPTGASVKVRISEWFHGGKVDNAKGWEADGTAVAATKGVLAVDLPEGCTDKAGLYRIEWGIVAGTGRLLASRRSFLLVQPSAFVDESSRKGPFTLEELRMSLRDSEGTDNFTLDNVEFGDEQIAMAIARPVELWNTETPTIRPTYTTVTFPFREQWLRATIGFLCEIAAQGYRRDTGLVDNAGGVSVKDKDKEVPYAREAERRITEYRMFMLHKKNEINMSRMHRVYVSPEYYRRGNAW